MTVLWVGIQDFQLHTKGSIIHNAWNEQTDHVEPCQVLHHKLKTTNLRLAEWSRGLFSKAKIHLHATVLVILHLDLAREERALSPDEKDLRAKLKRRVICLSVLERSINIQSSLFPSHCI